MRPAAPTMRTNSAAGEAAAVPAAGHGVIAETAGWGELADTALEANPFFAPVIASAALAHLGPGGARLACVRQAGRLVALAPVRATRLGRVAPAIGVWTHRYGPLGTPLLGHDDPDGAFARLVHEMAPAGTDRAILLFPDLPLEGAVARTIERFALAAGRPVARIGVHRRAMLLRPAAGAPPFREQIERRRRKELARQWRRLSEQGTLTVRRVTAAAERERAALAFLALEASGWKGRRGTALSDDPASRAFALAALTGSQDGSAVIDEVRLGDEAVAMLASFRAGDTAVTWKIAHLERLARFSPGVQVMIEATESWLADQSVARIDSLAAPDHPMIDGLWPDRVTIGLLAVGPVGGSLLFRLGVRLAEAEVAARHQLRSFRKRRRKPASAKETAT